MKRSHDMVGAAVRCGVLCLALVGDGTPATAADVPAPCGRLDAAAWLAGTWHAPSRDRLVVETWVATSTLTYEGRGTTQSPADGSVVDAEDLRLVAMGDGVFYVAKVAHNDYPVAFRLTACSADRLVFENPTHDFPRRLEYRRVAPGRLEVTVSDGGSRSFRLDFTRQPEA